MFLYLAKISRFSISISLSALFKSIRAVPKAASLSHIFMVSFPSGVLTFKKDPTFKPQDGLNSELNGENLAVRYRPYLLKMLDSVGLLCKTVWKRLRISASLASKGS